MSLLPYLLYLWLIGFHLVFLRDPLSIFGAAIELPILVVLMVAIYKKELAAIWFGFVTGLVIAAGLPVTGGLLGIVVALVGLAAYHTRQRMNLDSLYAKLLLVFVGVLVYNFVHLLLLDGGPFWKLLLARCFGSALYTTIVGWLFFLLREGKVTYKGVKEVF